mmetsp:Transcript_6207/g.11770  ORF Transcript_6207/g.11770 Transcript_6207/m.11770 type:complete len:328 (-) Transcript_6207:1073-2056(-)
MDAERVTLLPDLNNCLHTRISQLLVDQWSIVFLWTLDRIRFEATDEVRKALVESQHQIFEVVFKLGPNGGLLFSSSSHYTFLFLLNRNDLTVAYSGYCCQGSKIFWHFVAVLLHETVHLVGDRARVMLHLKLIGHTDFVSSKIRIFFVGFLETLCKVIIAAIWQNKLFIKHRKDPFRSFLDKIDTLLVVSKVDSFHADILLGIRLLLENENVLVEMLLKFLVGIIDAQLLEAVLLEALEPKNIQDTNHASTLEKIVFHFHGEIAVVDDKIKNFGIQETSKGVSSCCGLHRFEKHCDCCFKLREFLRALQHALLQLFFGDREQARGVF